MGHTRGKDARREDLSSVSVTICIVVHLTVNRPHVPVTGSIQVPVATTGIDGHTPPPPPPPPLLVKAPTLPQARNQKYVVGYLDANGGNELTELND